MLEKRGCSKVNKHERNSSFLIKIIFYDSDLVLKEKEVKDKSKIFSLKLLIQI